MSIATVIYLASIASQIQMLFSLCTIFAGVTAQVKASIDASGVVIQLKSQK